MKKNLLFVGLLMLGIYACSVEENNEGENNNNGNDTAVVVSPEIDYSLLKFNEINGNGADADKYIELYNGSDKTINLEGVTILYNNVDSEVGVSWFGTYADSILPQGFFLLKGSKKYNNPTHDLNTGLSGKQAMVLTLTDPDEEELDSFKISADDNREKSYSRIPDGSGTWYYTSVAGTQGVTNGTNAAGLAEIVILPSISKLKRDIVAPTPMQSVVVSATVTASFDVAISSVVLKWTCNGLPKSDIPMTASGDTYSATISGQVDSTVVTYMVVATNVNGAIESLSDSYTVATLTIDYSSLVINEVDGNGKFVEIYNKGAVAISLENVTLVKNESTTKNWWKGGASATIAAGGYYAISTKDDAKANPKATENTGDSGISAQQNLKFVLKSPAGGELDSFLRSNGTTALGEKITPNYETTTPAYSFARCPDGVGNFGLSVPSCNAANPNVSAGIIEAN